ITLGDDLRSPNGQGTIRYATSSAGPIYLRSSTLSNFSGGTWRPDENTSSESTNVGAIKDKTFDATAGNAVVTTTRVQAQAVKSAWLPVPYAPQNITGLKGSWSWDTGTLTVRSQNTSTLNQTYVVRSVMPQLTAAELTNASQPPGRELDQRYLQLPKDTPKIISTTAQQVAGSDTTAYAKAMALQTYLRSSAFTYSFQTPLKEGYDGSGMDVVAKFLEVKSGYCIHFSSAMAVMARELGIPSRIAVGYAPGHVTGNTVSIPGSEMTEYTVDGHDAHAWPELYFEGLGWVPFEPTPGRGQVPAYASNTVNGPAAPANPNDALVPTRSASAAAAASSNAATTSAAPKPEATGDSGNATAMDLRWLAVSVLALLVLAVLGLPGFLRFSARRRRLHALAGPESARVAWAELHDLCVDYAVPTLPSDTPRTLGNRLAAEISSRSSGPSDCSAQIERIRAAYEQLSYGNRSSGGSTSAVMTAQRSPTAADLQAIQQALADATSPWQRLRITVAPPSTINRVAQWFNARRNRRNAR
ncbi:MAG: transglutaminase domain-containing protein, partial [Acidobacteria bacterium]|nr:transglutaminase domain-containing protein [Acidobacteriota bacterium]